MGGDPRLPGQLACRMQDTAVIDRHQGRWEGRNFYRHFTELRWTGHEMTETVIFEAKVAMHHATSAQVQYAGI